MIPLEGIRRLAWPALLCAAPLPAAGALRCTDSAGNAYTLAQDPGATTGLQCVAFEMPPPATVLLAADAAADASDPARSSALDVTALLMRSRGFGRPAGHGMLALAPPVRDLAATSFERTGQDADVFRPTAFDALIVAIARATDQDADLLRAIVHVESRFDPNAVSPRGAIGLMQVMPATAVELGLAEPQRALFEPESNLRTGALYLRSLFERFAGQPALAVAAYNAGAAAVMRSGNAVPPIAETQKYVRDVLATWQQLRAVR